MSGPGQRFDPSELRIPGEPEMPSAERADALVAARELERVTAEGICPTDGFEDRVMAAIASEPAPRLVMRPGSAVRGGVAGAFLIAVRDAWGVATGAGRPVAVRAQAMAFVLLVVVAAGTLTSAAAVGVGGLLNGDRDSAPTVEPETTLAPTPVGPTQPAVESTDGESAEPSETPEASESAEPSETPEATETSESADEPGSATPRSTKPRSTDEPEPTDEPGSSDEPGSGDDGGGSGERDDGSSAQG